MSVSADGAYITSTVDGDAVAFAIADGAIASTTTYLPIADIRINGGTQSRVSLHEPTVAEYADVVRADGQLPPVVVFDDGVDVWLADGFHRYHGHRAAGADCIPCEVHFGTCRDAILYSVGANAAHGLRRTNDDKRRAVMTLLNDQEWSTWSDSAIAKACGVSDKTVAAHRNSIFGNSEDAAAPKTRVVERNGVTYEQNTANIGKAKPAAAADIAAAPTAPPAPADPPPVEVEHEHVGPSDEEVAAALKADADQAQYIRDLLERADDPLTVALADVDTMRRMNAVLESRLAGLQNTVNEQIRVINAQRKKLEKLERAS